MVTEGKKNQNSDSKIEVSQEKAKKKAMYSPITFIWGPPGTGKTKTLAEISLEYIKANKRVLMLSYSNVSVDEAVLRTFKSDDDFYLGKIVRYGYPRKQELVNNNDLVSYNLAISKSADLLSRRDFLHKKLRELDTASSEYVDVCNELSEIRRKVKEEEKVIVRKADFVATTLAKAVIDPVIYNGNFDVVIVDEASMAYIPQVVFAASIAQKNFVCMGDFKQLPPIVQGSKSSILNYDIFQYCGIADAVENNKGHNWLYMLDVQHRMNSKISDFVDMHMYHNLLKTAEGVDKEHKNKTDSEPISGQALVLADLSGMTSTITSANTSTINVLSAFVSFSIALINAKNFEIGVITPYRAQSRLLYSMARDISESYPEYKNISCATVHQFQGSEKDIVIYDAVDCYPKRHPGVLLTKKENNLANRLFNVAMTRSKGKFVAVTHVDYMLNKRLASDLLFSKLIRRYRNTEQHIKGNELISLFNSENPMLWLDEDKGNKIFLDDLNGAKQDILMIIPSNIVNDDEVINKIGDIISKKPKEKVSIKIRVAQEAYIPDCIRKYAYKSVTAKNPITIIDKKIVWYGEPLTNYNFNIGKEEKEAKYRPIIRFKGKHTAETLYRYLIKD